jgi:thymidine phosphorylase
MAGLARDEAQARDQLLQAWQSGAALQRFEQMVSALGGPQGFAHNPDAYLPKAAVSIPVWAEKEGCVSEIDTRAVGLAVVALGGGRSHPDDVLDLSVGFSELAFVGEQVNAQRPLGWVHARNTEQAEQGASALRAAYRLGGERLAERNLIQEIL